MSKSKQTEWCTPDETPDITPRKNDSSGGSCSNYVSPKAVSREESTQSSLVPPKRKCRDYGREPSYQQDCQSDNEEAAGTGEASANSREKRLEIIVNRLTSWTCASEAQLRKEQEKTLDLLRMSYIGWRDMAIGDMRWYYDDNDEERDPNDANHQGRDSDNYHLEESPFSSKTSYTDHSTLEPRARPRASTCETYTFSPRKDSNDKPVVYDWEHADVEKFKGCTPRRRNTQEKLSPPEERMSHRSSPRTLPMSNQRLYDEDKAGAGWAFCCMRR